MKYMGKTTDTFLWLKIWLPQTLLLLDEFKKFVILKKGIGIESQNLCKHFNDQKTMQTRWNSTVAIEQKVDSKVFAIPILTVRL